MLSIGDQISYSKMFDKAILDLYEKSIMFPTQKIDIYTTILELSSYKNASIEASRVVSAVREKYQAYKENIPKIDIVSDNISSNQRVLKLTNEDVLRSKDKNNVKREYYHRVFKIIKKMYHELGDNATDEDKLEWIYNYLLNIPFFHNYHMYSETVNTVSNGRINIRETNINPDLARVNYMNEYPNYKFGIFDKENLVLLKNPTGVCSAFGDLFKDLSIFANLNHSYCRTVSGRHCGEGHEWNAIFNEKGVFICDSSNLWDGRVDPKSQFMVPYREFKQRFDSYSSGEKCYEYSYVPKKHSIKIVSVSNNSHILNGNTRHR